jgi:hypothetical protein
VIGVAAFFYWFNFARFFQLHVFVSENEVERRSINMANVLLSYEEFLPNDHHFRGIFNKTSLDELATYLEKPDTTTYANAIIDSIQNARETNIGYPNSYIIFSVVDLETCDGNNCNGWVGAFKGPISLQAAYVTRFLDCLANNIDTEDPIGSIFRGLATSITVGRLFPPLTVAATLWQPWDIKKCWDNTIGELGQELGYIFFGYTSVPTISKGYPVIILYPNGEEHIGRLSVGVFQWA